MNGITEPWTGRRCLGRICMDRSSCLHISWDVRLYRRGGKPPTAPILTCSNVWHSTINHLNVLCWKKQKRIHKSHPWVPWFSRRGISSQVSGSRSFSFVDQSPFGHTSHIASWENLMGDHYAATTAGQFSPACNPACSTNFAGYDCMTVSEFILLS